jgi:hypothetical protein
MLCNGFPARWFTSHVAIWASHCQFTSSKKDDLIPLVDAVADRLPIWKSMFTSKAGRTMVTKVTLIVIPIHVSIAVEVSPWIYKEIAKL